MLTALLVFLPFGFGITDYIIGKKSEKTRNSVFYKCIISENRFHSSKHEATKSDLVVSSYSCLHAKQGCILSRTNSHPFIQKYLLKTDFVPGIVLGNRYT